MYIDSITQKNNWEPTYIWTTKFFNEHPDLKVGAEVGVADASLPCLSVLFAQPGLRPQ